MPNDRYRYLKWHKRVHDFPFTHAIAVGILLNTLILMFVAGLSPVGESMVLIMAAFAVPAGILILLGLHWRGSVITGQGIEAVGHWLAIGTWLIDIWLLITIGALANITAPAAFMVAHALRIHRLMSENRRIKRIVREAAEQEVGRD